jgi:hypothetical protein
MPCTSCGSTRVEKFAAEICIHFPGRENLDKHPVFVFTQLVVCLVCGCVEQFTIPPDELRALSAKDHVAA